MSFLHSTNRFFQRVTGLDSARITDCSAHFQRQASIQGLIMLTTPLLAAILVGLGLGLTFQSLLLGLAVGSLLCPLIYLAERATTTNLAPPGFLNWGLRIVLFLGVVGIHLLSADLAFFDKEIRAEAERRYDLLRSDTLMGLDRQIVDRTNRIAGYEHKTDSLQSEMAHDQNLILLEVDGLAPSGEKGVGKIAAWKEQYFADRRQTIYEPQFTAWNNQLAALHLERDSLQAIRLAVSNRVFPYEAVGPGERLSILHDLMGEEGGEGIWLLMLVILLLAAVSDFLPIVHRHTMDFAQYRAAHERAVSQRVGRQEAECNIALESARIEEHSSINQLTMAAEIEAQCRDLEILAGSVERQSKLIARIYQARLNATRLIGKLHAQSFSNLSATEQRAVEQAYTEALNQLKALLFEVNAQLQPND